MADFLEAEFPHRPLIGGNVLDVGEKMVMFGESEAGKSYLAIQLAYCLASASPFLGFTVPHRSRVLMLQSELSEYRYQERCEKLAVSYPKEMRGNVFVWSTETLKINVEANKQVLARIVEDTQADVVMVDPLRAFLRGSENESEDVESWLNAIGEIQEATHTFTLIYVHHINKPVPGFFTKLTKASARGSGLLTDRPSAALGLEMNETQTEWTLHFVKTRNREKRPEPILLAPDYTTGLFVPQGIADVGIKFDGLLELVGEGIAMSELATALLDVKGFANRQSTYEYVNRAAREKIVRKEKMDGTNRLFIRPGE